MTCSNCGHIAHPDSVCNTKGCTCNDFVEASNSDIAMGAITSHSTKTSDGSWDSGAAEKNLPNDEAALRSAHAWVDPEGDPAAKASYRFIHHEVATGGEVGAANIQACRTGVGVLNGGRGGTTIPRADYDGVYNHLARHMRDAGVDPPEKNYNDSGNAQFAKTKVEPAPVVDPETGAPFKRWRMPVAVLEGVRTGDGRKIAPEALTWRELPQPLMANTKTTQGHDGAELVGRIDEAKRIDASKMVDDRTGQSYGKGTYAVELSGVFTTDEDAAKVAKLITGRFLRGVSVDLSDVTTEIEFVDKDGETKGIEDPLEGLFLDGDMVETVTEGRIMGVCYDDQTQILTENRGWRSFADLDPDDRVATRDPKTGAFEWQQPTYYHHNRWSGPMIRFTSGTFRSLDLLVTPNHRMLVQSAKTGRTLFMPAEELAKKRPRSYRIPAVSEWNAPDVVSFLIGHSDSDRDRGRPTVLAGDEYAAFMGAYLSEGCVWGGDKGAYIAQRPTSKARDLYERMFASFSLGSSANEHGFRVHSAPLARYLRQFGTARNKYIPAELKSFSARQLRIFFDHYMAGDGSADGRRAYTSSARLAGDLQEIAQKLGMWAVVTEHQPRPEDQYIEGRQVWARGPSYVVQFRNRAEPGRPGGSRARATWNWVAERVEHHEGDVRCVSVPNEALYVRRNGIPAWCGNTITPFPAFEGAYIELVGDDGKPGPATQPSRPTATEQRNAVRIHSSFTSRECVPCVNGKGLTAGAGPQYPPRSWFEDPGLEKPTPLTVMDDGRVFGHLALWGTCHTGFSGTCVKPPRSATNYALFRTGAVKTAEGAVIAVGQITMDTKHANLRDSRTAALRHYDHTGTAVADAVMGEDEHGIWFAGALRPDVTEGQVRTLRAAALSGDWREWGGNLELLAALAVNAPGFPVVRELVASGMPKALVAASGELRQPETLALELSQLASYLPELRLLRQGRAERARARMAGARAAAARARMQAAAGQ